LFIEDVSEYKYTVDRMLINLKRSGKLKNLAGLIVGGFTATKEDTEVNYPMTMEEIIMEKVQEYSYPVCFHFPAGHQKINLALKLGLHYNLYVTDATCSLSEIADPHPAILPATRYSDSTQSEAPASLPDSSFVKRQ
jgi:muramoyltetrapeptide carboxypeptidase